MTEYERGIRAVVDYLRVQGYVRQASAVDTWSRTDKDGRVRERNDPELPDRCGLDAVIAALCDQIRSAGCGAVSIAVRQDGRVTIEVRHPDSWLTGQTEHADLLPGGSLPLPSKAIASAITAVKARHR